MIGYYLGTGARGALTEYRGSEYKGKLENHAYAFFLSVEGAN